MTAALDLISVSALKREVADLERVIALVRQRDALKAELEGMGVAWTAYPLTLDEIIMIIAARHGMTLADLTGLDTDQPVVRARHEAMFVLDQQVRADGRKRFSQTQIARAFCRDPSSVSNGIARHRERMASGDLA